MSVLSEMFQVRRKLLCKYTFALAPCSSMLIFCPFPVAALRDFSVSHNRLDSLPPCESAGLVVCLYRMAACSVYCKCMTCFNELLAMCSNTVAMI